MNAERQKETWDRVHKRVLWWIQDMSYKPNEVLTEHYFECMAQDIADFAMENAEDERGKLSAMDRLDPPRPRRPPSDPVKRTIL